MNDFQGYFQAIRGTPLESAEADFYSAIERAVQDRRHGELPRWLSAVAGLPEIPPHRVRLDQPVVSVGTRPLAQPRKTLVRKLLMELHPWRKGPFYIHGEYVDCEWHSDWKWARLAPHIQPLAGRRVLDVGCGNGYYCWRMRGAGAEMVIGIDRSWLYVMQFRGVRHFLGEHPVFLLPLTIEEFPPGLYAFDTVFSMGVLYHRREPIEHLRQLRACLRAGGELVLESLVIHGEAGDLLLPKGRYGQMRNVWSIPSPATLCGWIERCGYSEVKLVDISVTTIAEQRSTDWMRFQSLADSLDPGDPSRTREGHPAPRRAIVVATNPHGLK